MAITFDAASDSATQTTVSGATLTFAATVNSGSNRILIVCATGRDGSAISSVTWNTSESLTKAIEKDASNGLVSSIWYLVAPTATSANVVITSSGQSWMGGVAISLFGADQVSPIEDTDSIETSGANPAFSGGLVSITDNAAIVDSACTNQVDTSSTMSGETTNRIQRANFVADNGAGREVMASTIITKSPAGSATTGWNIASNNSSYVGVVVKPASGGGGGGGGQVLWAQSVM